MCIQIARRNHFYFSMILFLVLFTLFRKVLFPRPRGYFYPIQILMRIFFKWLNSGKWNNQESAALSMPANLENSAMATGLEKVSFHFNPKGKAKECSNYHTIAIISHASFIFLGSRITANGSCIGRKILYH